MEALVKPPANVFDVLITAWLKWRDHSSSPIPCRHEIHPKDMTSILPYVMVLDNLKESTASYSLVGEQMKIIYTNNLKSRNIISTRANVITQKKLHKYLIENIQSKHCGTLTRRLAQDSQNRDWHYDVLTLPLLNKDGSYSLIITVDMEPLVEDKKSAWMLVDSLTIDQAILLEIERLDLGEGVFDFPYDLAAGVKNCGVRTI
ncbi:PAS domain-containing protein [Temperatibacter marinus]|uniref:PAS domain-containing protein n=1 Tax=Temperatibacter marinus TaxID=1456591 RepID=A0AA52H9Q4_9PROT|nr:PAS domain-containing protein [Temperatibacter marinus]WND03159.1 PAS domain-containing protein [Temperatibacter marinus]